MASQLAHVRGAIGLAGVGWVAEVETFTITPVGDPEDLEALEGTVGQLEPKGKRLEITGTVFIPSDRAAYDKILEYWNGFTRVEMYAVFGIQFISAYGRFNAFRGENPKLRRL
jgi:hypothetical protein